METPLKLLSLDISSHTGFAVFNVSELQEFGLINIEIKDFKATQHPEKHPSYPQNLFDAADVLANHIEFLVKKHQPNQVVIENTVCGRQRSSQRMLEWFHFTTLKRLQALQIPFAYMDPSEWRKVLEMRLSKEEKQNNRQVSQGLKRGRITKKHLSVNLANEHFGLSLKQKENDIADAINLGSAFLKRLTS